MREEGIVERLCGGGAVIRVERRGTCGSCRVCDGSHAGHLLVTAQNTAGAAPGDTVVLEIEDADFLKAAFTNSIS